MPSKKSTATRVSKTDWARVDVHVIQPEEYEEIPELTDEEFARGVFKRAGRPVAVDPRRQVTIRVPESVLARWRNSGPGWQTRMAELLAKRAP
jgi:uncharacterized protein (DUF4415 family)